MVLNKMQTNLNTKKVFYLVLIISISVFLFSFIRDWQLDTKRLPCDLRNRVVGARLLFTEESPYFYKWQNNDPVELYDLAHYREVKVSAVTASPFFLLLIKPISYLSFFTISKVWLIAEYLCIVLIILLSIILAKNYMSKSLSLIFICLFTLSNAWQCHTDLGQSYILIAALFMLIYFLLHQYPNNKKRTYIATFLSIILILIRPISALLLFPYLFQFNKLKNYLISLSILGLVSVLIIWLSPHQNKLWKDYFYSVNYVSQFHQGNIKPDFNFKPVTEPKNIEGYEMSEIKKMNYQKAYKEYFINYYKFPTELGLRKLSMKETAIHFSILFTLSLVLSFFLLSKIKDYQLSLEVIFCLGLLLYIAAEIFIPVQRATYNQVQWLPFIAIFFSFKSVNKVTASLICLVMILMIVNITNFESQIIVSELIAFLTLLVHLITIYKGKKKFIDNP